MEEFDNKVELLSIKQLKQNLKESLAKSGVANTIKSQIRSEFIRGLAPRTTQEQLLQQQSLDIQEKVLYSLIFHVFKSRKLVNSLSVFVPESGINPNASLLSEKDIKALLKYNQIATNYDRFHDEKENLLSPNAEALKKQCIMDYILQFCLNMNQNVQKEMSTQTEMSGPSIREYLDLEVSKLHKQYSERSERESQKPSRTIEERMMVFQRECEARFQHDLKMQIAAVRENEMLKVRLEENAKCRLALEQQRQELDAEYGLRLKGHMEREAASVRRLADQERELHQSQYDARQLLQKEIDDLRAREALALRKAELESQGIRLLELRLKESEQVLVSREREIGRREKVLDDKMRDCSEAARREAHAQVLSELDAIAKDRNLYVLERQRLEEEKSLHAAFLANYAAVKKDLQMSTEEMIGVKDELAAMRRAADMRRAEDDQIMKLMSAQEHFSPIEHILSLIEERSKLASELAAVRDPRGLETALKASQRDLADARKALSDTQRQTEIDANRLRVELDALKLKEAEEQKRLSSQDATIGQLRAQLVERNKTIDSLSQLNNWQPGHESAKHWRSSSQTTVDKWQSTIPVLGDDLFYTNALMSSPDYIASVPHDALPNQSLSTAESLFAPAKSRLSSGNPYNYPVGKVPPSHFNSGAAGVQLPPPSFRSTVASEEVYQPVPPPAAPVTTYTPMMPYGTQYPLPGVAAAQQVPPSQPAPAPAPVPAPVAAVQPNPYRYAPPAVARESPLELPPAKAPSPVAQQPKPLETLNPPLISEATYNPKQDKQSILYYDDHTPPYQKPASPVEEPVRVAPAPVVAATPAPTPVVAAPAPAASVASLIPAAAADAPVVAAGPQLLAVINKFNSGSLSVSPSMGSPKGSSPPTPTLRDAQAEKEERERQVKLQMVREEANRVLAEKEKQRVAELEQTKLANALVAEQERQRREEARAREDALERKRLEDEAAEAEVRLQEERNREAAKQRARDEQLAREKEEKEARLRQEKAAEEERLLREAEQREANRFKEMELERRRQEAREAEEAERAERDAAEREQRERREAVRRADEERLRAEREAREEAERAERQAEADRLARIAEEKRRDADEFELAKQRARERRMRSSQESQDGQTIGVGVSVTSSGGFGRSGYDSKASTVTFDESERPSASLGGGFGGVRGSTTSAFSYGGDNDSLSDGGEESGGLGESGNNDNTMEVNDLSDDSQDRSW